jgi:GNAT superfamily N-acetyltransferase
MNPSGPNDAVTLHDPQPGDLGWVVQRQAILYAHEYGWDWRFEGLVAGIVAGFVQNFDAARERCWIARLGGRPVGSIFLVRKSDAEAQLRLLFVEADARGHGVGAQLVDACMAAARQMGYRRMSLWTNAVLVSARRLYQARGFTLVDEEAHNDFGVPQTGQHWVVDL